MALYIEYNYGPDSEYHIGKKVIGLDEIKMLQADGDELDHIRKTFVNIPMTNSRVVRWFGETATFIAANIGLEKAVK